LTAREVLLDAERPSGHSHAGAWERVKSCSTRGCSCWVAIDEFLEFLVAEEHVHFMAREVLVDAERPRGRSHAGAWERVKSCSTRGCSLWIAIDEFLEFLVAEEHVHFTAREVLLDAERPRGRSHAGAWERVNILSGRARRVSRAPLHARERRQENRRSSW
jgi:hypothetical protein